MKNPFKHILPQSLFGRALLILVLPTILVQIMAGYVFYARHWENVSRWMAVSLAGEIALLAHEINGANPARQDQFAMFAERLMEIQVEIQPDDKAQKFLRSGQDISPIFFRELQNRLSLPFSVELVRGEQMLRVRVKLENALLQIQVSRKRLNSTTTDLFMMWLFGSATLLTGIAVLFLRNQVKPISKLAGVMDEFGKGHDEAGFRPQGAEEVRRAGRAFIQMKQRIDRQITARMEMLAGISHDLRTPLTRMKLQLEFLKNTDKETVEELRRDVVDMEYMITEYLDFVRGEGQETPERQALMPYMEDLVMRYKTQGRTIPIVTTNTLGVEIYLRSNALRRALTNVIDNALRYGKICEIHITPRTHHVEICIDDQGPGIPVAEREEVFKPFIRLDASRNAGTGGVGLGLTITRDIILAHGGEVSLHDAPKGGLRVLIRMPLA